MNPDLVKFLMIIRRHVMAIAKAFDEMVETIARQTR